MEKFFPQCRLQGLSGPHGHNFFYLFDLALDFVISVFSPFFRAHIAEFVQV